MQASLAFLLLLYRRRGMKVTVSILYPAYYSCYTKPLYATSIEKGDTQTHTQTDRHTHRHTNNRGLKLRLPPSDNINLHSLPLSGEENVGFAPPEAELSINKI